MQLPSGGFDSVGLLPPNGMKRGNMDLGEGQRVLDQRVERVFVIQDK